MGQAGAVIAISCIYDACRAHQLGWRLSRGSHCKGETRGIFVGSDAICSLESEFGAKQSLRANTRDRAVTEVI
ncbi:hypothetical protein FBZ98_110171 [Rhizobium sp. ERR 922]|nr:hypothetical protein FBZ98_110171 [Rhizobium sp. ERR 922]TWB90854.1 hypothetical protein FBZ97_10891 [Rhizobium sp. ERR 942]